MFHLFLATAAGGVITSFAEYHFQYNLFDYIVKGVKKVFGAAKAVETEVKDKL